eukprot:1147447-Pelagomonas_calceolata.AAC.11
MSRRRLQRREQLQGVRLKESITVTSACAGFDLTSIRPLSIGVWANKQTKNGNGSGTRTGSATGIVTGSGNGSGTRTGSENEPGSGKWHWNWN